MDLENVDYRPLPQLPFIFLGGALSLDLVNTRRSRRLPGSRTIIQFDQLWDSAQADAWWAEACVEHNLKGFEVFRWTDDEYRLLIALRAELRALFEAVIGGSTDLPSASALNGILARGSYSVCFMEGIPHREYSSREGGRDALLAIALSASEFLAERDLSRLRDCRSERCTLLFYDGSKSGTRHWCKEECMNRARARANYWKSKEEGGGEG